MYQLCRQWTDVVSGILQGSRNSATLHQPINEFFQNTRLKFKICWIVSFDKYLKDLSGAIAVRRWCFRCGDGLFTRTGSHYQKKGFRNLKLFGNRRQYSRCSQSNAFAAYTGWESC